MAHTANQRWMVPGEVADQSAGPCHSEFQVADQSAGPCSIGTEYFAPPPPPNVDGFGEIKVLSDSVIEQILVNHARSIERLFTERLADQTMRIMSAIVPHRHNGTAVGPAATSAPVPRKGPTTTTTTPETTGQTAVSLTSSTARPRRPSKGELEAWLSHAQSSPPSEPNPQSSPSSEPNPSPLPPALPPPDIGMEAPGSSDPMDSFNPDTNESTPKGKPSLLRISSTTPSKIQYNYSLARLVESRAFETFTSLCVVFNAISMGFQADWAMRNPELRDQLAFDIIDYGFTTIFTIELSVRIGAAGMRFVDCENEDFNWNVTDAVLVASALLEILGSIFDFQIFSVSFMRAVRLMRLVRVLRILRVFRFFKDLRVMVVGIMASMRPLMWALILLFMVMYVFAVGMMQIVVANYDSKNRQVQEELTLYFGSLPTAIFTLFRSITGGIDWSDAAAPLVEVSWSFAFAFSIYVAFCSMCVLNIVTGIFVENASQMSAKDDDLMLMDEIEKRKQWIQQVKELFENADKDGQGELSWEEFSVQLKDIRVQRVLLKLGIDVNATSHESIFQQFDFDGSGSIAISEFTTSLMRLHGSARSLDIAELRHMLNGIKIDISNLPSNSWATPTMPFTTPLLPDSAPDEVHAVSYGHVESELV